MEDNNFVPVKERFAKAKRDQQQKEAEKIEKIKGNRKPGVDTSDNTDNGDDADSPMTPKKQSVSSRWAQTLEESKNHELNKFSNKKKSTLEAFQITKGTGIVKRHIDKWEDLFMQINITATQLKATFDAAVIKAKRKNEEIEALRSSQRQSVAEDMNDESGEVNMEDYELNSEPELVVNGSTLLYDKGMFGTKTNLILESCLLKNENKPIPLPCGMYSGDNRSPPISIVAVGMVENNEIYIAITVTIVEGQEACASAYGPKKIVIFANDDKKPIYERIIEIIDPNPVQDEVDRVDQLTEEYDDENDDRVSEEEVEESEDVAPEDPSSTIIESETAETVETVATSVEEVQVKVEEEEEVPTLQRPVSPVASLAKSEDSTSHAVTPVVSTAKSEDSTSHAVTPVVSIAKSEDSIIHTVTPAAVEGINLTRDIETFVSPLSPQVILPVVPVLESTTIEDIPLHRLGEDSDDENAEEAESPRESNDGGSAVYNFNKTLTLPTSRGDSVFFPPGHRAFKNKAWIEEDERLDVLAPAKNQLLKVQVSDVVAYTSTYNGLLLQLNDGSTVVVTGTLKSVVTPSKCTIVDDNIIFEWTRGAAASGWMTKWPMKSQRAGRMTKRFFLLRDSVLSYYKRKPMNEEQAETGLKYGLQLNETSSISKGRHFLIPCITVTTNTDTLWTRCGKNVAEEDNWIKEIRKGIAQHSKSHLFYTKGRLETIWHHESPYFSCIATDATKIRNSQDHEQYLHCGLFMYDSNAIALGSLKPVTLSNGSLTQQYKYAIDISFNGYQRQQLELQAYQSVTNASPTDIGSKLAVVAIFNDQVVIIGGSNGYVGFGNITQEAIDYGIVKCTSASHYLEDLANAAPAAAAGVNNAEYRRCNGHSFDSTIRCISTLKALGMYVCGDDEGGISLWSAYNQPTPSKGVLESFVNVKELGGAAVGRIEQIRNITVFNHLDDASFSNIVVSTNERLLIIKIDVQRKCFYSWHELDRVLPGCEALFSLNISSVDPSIITLWKLVGNDSDSRTKAGSKLDSIVYRLDFKNQFNDNLASNTFVLIEQSAVHLHEV